MSAPLDPSLPQPPPPQGRPSDRVQDHLRYDMDSADTSDHIPADPSTMDVDTPPQEDPEDEQRRIEACVYTLVLLGGHIAPY